MSEKVLQTIKSSLLSKLELEADWIIAETRRLAEFNSGTTNVDGLNSVANELTQLFGEWAHNTEQRALPAIESVVAGGTLDRWETSPMLIFSRNEHAPLQLLCTGHYDTVFPADSSFQTTWVEGNHLRGPGVADMKGGLMVLLATLKAMSQTPLDSLVGITVAISPEEEIGSPCSAIELTKLAKNKHYGLTYEPALADGTLAGARKGSGNFSMVIKGLAKHAGREFFKGKNAITAGAEFATKIEALSNRDSGLTVNVGKIEGGGPVNVVPELAIVRFNIRVDQPADTRVIDTINKLAKAIAEDTGCTFDLHGHFNRPPKPMTPEQQEMFELLRSCGAELGLDVQWKPTGGCCEGNNLAAAGLLNIDTLGVRGGLIHSDGEFACLDSFAERAQLSALLIAALAEKTIPNLNSLLGDS
ncbi:hydrolase [uncultured Umboniibacter sp.]|uniref:hydrolase n=1 Tax=uncultured Umboniibacter sp. TaxID=1798917 RepID=UPI00260C7E3F|nr:hydrolase [uncultured Umboniibacter sp.]